MGIQAKCGRLRAGGVISRTPAAQSFGVVRAERVVFRTAQARSRGAALEALHTGQHAAGENVLLNKISGAAIAFEVTLIDGDGLHQRLATRFQARRQRIESDLAEAQRLKGESDAAIAANEKALAEARGRAQTLANETREKAATAAEARRKEVDAKLQSRIAEAEKTIAATRSAAMANVHGIASDTAPAIVQRLAGITPATEEVAEAVTNVLKH